MVFSFDFLFSSCPLAILVIVQLIVEFHHDRSILDRDDIRWELTKVVCFGTELAGMSLVLFRDVFKVKFLQHLHSSNHEESSHSSPSISEKQPLLQ